MLREALTLWAALTWHHTAGPDTGKCGDMSNPWTPDVSGVTTVIFHRSFAVNSSIVLAKRSS
jgi:hypothetical protein